MLLRCVTVLFRSYQLVFFFAHSLAFALCVAALNFLFTVSLVRFNSRKKREIFHVVCFDNTLGDLVLLFDLALQLLAVIKVV